MRRCAPARHPAFRSGARRYDLVWGISIGLAVFAALLNVPVREEPVARLRAVPEGAP